MKTKYELAVQDLTRMINKRNEICLLLGYGYDYHYVESLIAINSKIEKLQLKLSEMNY